MSKHHHHHRAVGVRRVVTWLCAGLLVGGLLGGCKPEPAKKDENAATASATGAGEGPATESEASPGGSGANEESPGGDGVAPAAGGDAPPADSAPGGGGDESPVDDASTITAAGHLRRWIEPAQLKMDGSCIGEKADPCGHVTPQSLPVCDAAPPTGAIGLEMAIEQRNALLDQEVIILHTLSAEGGGCTEMACDRQCCNGCFGAIHLQLPGGGSGYRTLPFASSDSALDDRWKCEGDESAVCCNTIVPTGLVMVKGTLRNANAGFYLENPDVCVVPP